MANGDSASGAAGLTNQSCLNILAWCWSMAYERSLIVMNFSDTTSQALVKVPWDELRGRAWRFNDVLSGEIYDRSGDEMRDSGLYVDLGPWRFLRAAGPSSIIWATLPGIAQIMVV